MYSISIVAIREGCRPPIAYGWNRPYIRQLEALTVG